MSERHHRRMRGDVGLDLVSVDFTTSRAHHHTAGWPWNRNGPRI
ncbi:hypothetical protein [Actinomadura sp. GTD37]